MGCARSRSTRAWRSASPPAAGPNTCAWLSSICVFRPWRPAKILIACVEAADVEGLAAAPDLVVIASAPGLTLQRNAILDRLPGDCEFIVFFDDDFFPQREWLARAIAAFEARPDVACITGQRDRQRRLRPNTLG